MADFIPSGDDQFDGFLSALNTYAQSHEAAIGLTTAQNAALAAAYEDWQTNWTAWQQEQNTYNSLLAAKNEARAAATTVVRQINAAVQANPAVEDAAREAAGLPVHKTTRSRTPDLETHPVLYRVDNEHLLQRLWFSDQDTPGSKAKPRGAAMCEIRQQVVAQGGAAPTDPDAMGLLALDTKAPHRTDFEAGDVGKTAYYAQRWVNTTGQPGPWGPITSYLVT